LGEGGADDECAEVPPVWYDILIDAGALDAAALTDGGVLVVCACVGSSGRRPRGFRARLARGATALGAYLAQAARLEAASVHAFERLRAEMEAHGAPRALLDAIDHARTDEARHAAVMSRLARRCGGRVRSVTAPRTSAKTRSALALAIENAREGCVREAFGALVATYQAMHATDVDARRTMRAIAVDETRHAELAWRVAAMLDAKLDDERRARVRREHHRTRRMIEREAMTRLPNEITAPLGLPAPSVASAMLRALDATLWRSQFAGKKSASGVAVEALPRRATPSPSSKVARSE
jgi:hypothetical protein